VLRRIWFHRHLLYSLVRRQYHLRYRQSFAGVAWALVPPLATLGAAALVFKRVIGVETGPAPYAIFVLSALAPWTFFANSLFLGVPSVVNAWVMVTRLAFPRAILPLSTVGISLLDLAISGIIFVVFAYAVGDGLPATAIWFPLLVLLEIILIVGVVLLTSALNVFARDVGLAVPLIVQVWFFLTPVVYGLNTVPQELRGLYLANPMTGVVESFRNVLVYGKAPDFGLLFAAVLGAVGILLVGSWYFRTTESRFSDVI
jgi:ABC-type polysaccharide/polyol phosphate export permease